MACDTRNRPKLVRPAVGSRPIRLLRAGLLLAGSRGISAWPSSGQRRPVRHQPRRGRATAGRLATPVGANDQESRGNRAPFGAEDGGHWEGEASGTILRRSRPLKVNASRRFPDALRASLLPIVRDITAQHPCRLILAPPATDTATSPRVCGNASTAARRHRGARAQAGHTSGGGQSPSPSRHRAEPGDSGNGRTCCRSSQATTRGGLAAPGSASTARTPACDDAGRSRATRAGNDPKTPRSSTELPRRRHGAS
jgi:hypothetical protein